MAIGDIGQSHLCKGSSEKGLSKPMVIVSSKKSSYGANSASCAGGWTWVIKFINSSTGIKVRLFCLRRRVPQTWRTSAAFSPPPPPSSSSSSSSSSPPPSSSSSSPSPPPTYSSPSPPHPSSSSSSLQNRQNTSIDCLGGEPVLLVYGAWVQPNPYCFSYEPVYVPGFTDQDAHIVA